MNNNPYYFNPMVYNYYKTMAQSGMPYMMNTTPNRQTNSGATILINNGSKLSPMVSKATTPGGLKGAEASGGGSPVPVIFPKADPNWYLYGYPGTVDAGKADGGLVDYIPVTFYARNSGKIYIGMNEIDIYKGYLDSSGKYVKTFDSGGRYYNKGDYVFTILLSKNAGAARYSKIENDSYWNLLSDISNIQPGQTITKSVSVTSGVTTEESKTFSTTIGSTVGFEAGIDGAKVSASLSLSLTNSFSTSVSVSTQITVTDTVNFPAQEKAQRAALYQFQEKYKIIPGGPLNGWKDYLNGTSSDEAKFFSSRFVCSIEQPPAFDYPSKYFATSFVLAPDSK